MAPKTGRTAQKRKSSGAARLLIVEVEPLIAFDIEKVLTDAGFEVIGTASTAAEAITVDEMHPVLVSWTLASPEREMASRRLKPFSSGAERLYDRTR